MAPLAEGDNDIRNLCTQVASDYYDDSRPELFDHVDDAFSDGGGAESIYASITTIPNDGCMSSVEFVTGLAETVQATMEDEYNNIVEEALSLTDGIYAVLDGINDLIEEVRESLKETLRSTLAEIFPDSTKIEAFVDQYLDENIKSDIESLVDFAAQKLDDTIGQMKSYASVEAQRLGRYISKEQDTLRDEISEYISDYIDSKTKSQLKRGVKNIYDDVVNGIISEIGDEIEFDTEDETTFAGISVAILDLIEDEGPVIFFVSGGLNVSVVDTTFYLQ